MADEIMTDEIRKTALHALHVEAGARMVPFAGWEMPLNYGSHPYHHVGMPGTVIVRENIAREFLMDVMLGLWNDGFRKQIYINNHGVTLRNNGHT